MKLIPSLAALSLLLSSSTVVTQAQWATQEEEEDCLSFTDTLVSGNPALVLSYVADVNAGVFRAEVTYSEPDRWVGLGINPNLPNMIGASAVIGQSTGVARYNLGGYTESAVTLNEDLERLPPEGSVVEAWTTNETHSILTVGIPLEFVNLMGTTNFLVAGGFEDTLPFHAARSPIRTVVNECISTTTSGGMMEEEEETEAPTASPTVAMTEAPTVAPVMTEAPTSTGNGTDYVVGQVVMFEGYVMDHFCVARGSFVDTGLPSLPNADQHTVHCLIDPPNCVNSPFELLMDPEMEGDSWTREFTLDSASKDKVVELAKAVGDCTQCTGEGTLVAGFRIAVTAEVTGLPRNMTAGAGPLISVRELAWVAPDGTVTDANDILGVGGTGDGDNTNTNEPPADDASSTTSSSGVCDQPTTLTFDEIPGVTITYQIGVDDSDRGTFSATVVYEGVGWVGMGFSPTGTMPNSNAVIGVPNEEDVTDDSGPAKYLLTSYVIPTKMEESKQTLLASDLSQNDTHTVLSFTKLLVEPDEVAIDPNGNNFFLVAVGSSNELAYHAARHPFELSLACGEVGAGAAATEAPMMAPALDVEVGQVVSIEGFVMDYFCIERGTLFDNPTIMTLEQPNLHSVHCLLDVPQCVATNYEVLMDPLPGETMYRRAMTLDEDSKAMITMVASELATCETCTGGRISHGFRANFTATVLDLGDAMTGAPPMVSVSDVEPVLFITDSSTEATFEVGDRVTVTGFIMDYFCIERGTLLDNPSVMTLEQPELHSLHCLIDVAPCVASNYEVLLDPAEPGMDYTRGFVLDDAAKAMVQAIAKEVGICSDCDGTGDWEFGFRAQLMGTVTSLGMDGEPPVISVQMATPMRLDADGKPTATDGTGEEEPDAPASLGGDGPVDCDEFQSTYTYPNLGLTLNYVVTLDDDGANGNFTAEVVYEGQGWVGFGISTDGSMIGSLAVIGVPGEPIGASNPGKYMLNAKAVSGVALLPDAQQTIMDGEITQNDTHTVLTFTKRLIESGEIEISFDGSSINNFLAAAGSENPLGFHVARGSVGLGLSPCTADGVAESTVQESGATDTMQSSFKAHGWLACIAWGILVPIAIGNSLCRHLIPVKGLWFEVHRAFNSLAVLLTIVTFIIVVIAVEKSSNNPEHFQPTGGTLGNHKTIGLVVFILSLIQGVGGVMRPHTPDSGESKSSIRTVWEFVHRGSGLALLGMAWYQCHSGLTNAYLARFPDATDYVDVFWGVTGSISGIVVVGALTRFVLPPPPADAPANGDGANKGTAEQPTTRGSDGNGSELVA